MTDDVETYFNIDLNERLKGTTNSKRDWLIRWEHSIHASIKRALRNKIKNHHPIWTYLERDKAPRFFVRRHRALTNSRNEARKKKTLRDTTLHSSAGYETRPMNRSTSRIPSPGQPTAYKEDLPASEVFSRPPEDERNDKHGEEKNDLQERSTTDTEMVGINKNDIVAPASDRGGSVCVFYSFQVR